MFAIKLNKNRFLSKSWKGYLVRKVLSMSIHSSEFFRILLNIFGLIFLRKELINWIILIYSQSLVLWEIGIIVPSINWGVSIWLTHSRSIALCGVKLIDWELIRRIRLLKNSRKSLLYVELLFNEWNYISRIVLFAIANI